MRKRSKLIFPALLALVALLGISQSRKKMASEVTVIGNQPKIGH